MVDVGKDVCWALHLSQRESIEKEFKMLMAELFTDEQIK